MPKSFKHAPTACDRAYRCSELSLLVGLEEYLLPGENPLEKGRCGAASSAEDDCQAPVGPSEEVLQAPRLLLAVV